MCEDFYLQIPCWVVFCFFFFFFFLGAPADRLQKAAAGAHRPGRRTSAALRGHLLGVGPVPEDGVAVGHHFGTGLLAKYTQQQHHADEQDHFHLQHHYGETRASIPLLRRAGQVGRVGRFEPGQVMRLIHVRLRVPGADGGRWRTGNARNIDRHREAGGRRDVTIREGHLCGHLFKLKYESFRGGKKTKRRVGDVCQPQVEG